MGLDLLALEIDGGGDDDGQQQQQQRARCEMKNEKMGGKIERGGFSTLGSSKILALTKLWVMQMDGKQKIEIRHKHA